MGPFSICSVVLPEGRGAVPVPLQAEGIVVWPIGCSDSGVRPEDRDVDPPVVRVVPGIAIPLFSILLSWPKLCSCRPHTVLGMSYLVALGGFEEDLNEEVWV